MKRERYQIFGKKKEESNFRSFNYWSFKFTEEAETYSEDSLERLRIKVGGLNYDNPEYEFKIKRIYK